MQSGFGRRRVGGGGCLGGKQCTSDIILASQYCFYQVLISLFDRLKAWRTLMPGYI